jgi:hypothetical protein
MQKLTVYTADEMVESWERSAEQLIRVGDDISIAQAHVYRNCAVQLSSVLDVARGCNAITRDDIASGEVWPTESDGDAIKPGTCGDKLGVTHDDDSDIVCDLPADHPGEHQDHYGVAYGYIECWTDEPSYPSHYHPAGLGGGGRVPRVVFPRWTS